MTVKTILKMGDPRLLRIAPPVTQFDTDELHLLVTDLLDTMRSADGAGLAAPQIGMDLQVVIFGTDSVNPRYPQAPLVPRTVLINPVITPLVPSRQAPHHWKPLQLADTQDLNQPDLSPYQLEDWEGCLSVPGLRGKVPRFTHIRYAGFNQYGDVIDRTVEGFHARVVQHECDHLIGKLYPMRMRDLTQFGFTSELFPGLDPQDE
jgi:peptide deformylase